MSRISDYAATISAFILEQPFPFADRLVVSVEYIPVKITAPNFIHLDIMPASYHGETIEQRRFHVRQEDNAVCILVRSKLPEKFTGDDINTLMDAVESISDLMLNATWGDDTRCSSVDVVFNEVAKGLFSATITAHIKSQWS